MAPGWWADRRFLMALVLLSAVPLAWPALPPLTDALGHIARYHIETTIDRSPALQRYYSFHWALIGNLGVDVLIVPLAKLLGVELATKLVAFAIPPLTVAALILIAIEVHGRTPPTLSFALPLAYGYPFQFGFLNFSLSMALALTAFALWLRMGRLGRYRWRGAVFVPLGLLLWGCHVFGWALLATMAAAAETLVLVRGRAYPWQAFRRFVFALLPLAPPFLLMAMWRSGEVAGETGDWFNLSIKLTWLIAVLRDRWEVFDRISAAVLLFLAVAGALERRLGYATVLAVVTAALGLAFLVLPRILLGSAYADMRLVPYLLAMAIVAIRAPANPRLRQALALGALLFFLVRIGASTASYAMFDQAYRRQLAAIDHIPYGARVIAFVGTVCQRDWSSARMEHLGGIASVRRDAFVNDSWALSGAQLLTVHYPEAGAFTTDPSQIIRPIGCRQPGEPLRNGLLPSFPHRAFDYLWVIDLHGADAVRDNDLRRVWSINNGALYRIVPR